jgi:hypothetical protein
LLVVNSDAPGEIPGRYDFAEERAVLIYMDSAALDTPTEGTAEEKGGFTMYAQMEVSVPTTTAVDTAAVKVGGTWVAGLLDSFTFEANNRLIYTGAAERVFLVVGTFDIKSSASVKMTLLLTKNGVTLGANHEITEDAVAADNEKAMAIASLVSLKPNEYIELWAKASASANLTMGGAVTVIG